VNLFKKKKKKKEWRVESVFGNSLEMNMNQMKNAFFNSLDLSRFSFAPSDQKNNEWS